MLHKRDYTPGKRGPLDGVRILDLSRLVAGNTLTGLLADFGAEVVKVEPAAGDTLRAWRTKDVQVNWKLYARNKKSIALELRKPEARELLMKLVEKSDVFVESFRPDTLEKMGLAPEALLARNPRLVIVRISGWGQDGPYRRRPGSAATLEGPPPERRPQLDRCPATDGFGAARRCATAPSPTGRWESCRMLGS